MQIELNPIDVLSRKIYDAHKTGASIRSSVSPCSKCRNKPEGAVRAHFHGSEFGQCMLKTYRDCLAGTTFDDPLEGKVSEDDIDARAAFLLDGHLHEQNIIKNIEFGGMQIVGFGNEEQYEREIQVYKKESLQGPGRFDFLMPHTIFSQVTNASREKMLEGFEEAFKIIAHLDGLLIVKNKKTGEELLIGIECKAVKQYTWEKIKKTQEISDIWYGQMQNYFTTNHNIARFYLFIKHRHTSQLMKPILIMRDDKYINRRLNVLDNVFNALVEDNPEKYNIKSEHTSPKDSECKFCPYKQQCYGKVELNTVYDKEEENGD